MALGLSACGPSLVLALAWPPFDVKFYGYSICFTKCRSSRYHAFALNQQMLFAAVRTVT